MSTGRIATAAEGANYERAPVSDDVIWQLQGLCGSGEHDPNLWYPEAPQVEIKALQAKRICGQCPVLQQCRDWALLHHEHAGVWGGLSAEDRKRVWQGLRPRTPRIPQYRRRHLIGV